MNAPTPASSWVLATDCAESGLDAGTVRTAMLGRIREMRDSIRRGLASNAPSITGMVGWNAKGLQDAPDVLNAPLLKRVQTYAMAVNEENARMGRIVAAPTAGSAGTIPGALIGVADHLGLGDDQLVMPMVLAAGIGQAISRQMFISGAAGGCQAEIGSSAAMAAAAVTELLGGSSRACVHAASMALMNTIGLVCDPVGGFVEVPCVSRNAFFAVHAVSAAQLALANLESFIPPDEVVTAMAQVGRMMPLELRETAEGGLAQTPTGLAVTATMKGR
ncbi:L-serine ammonia-lyase, iron-sulfur-dependent, subunit beta [Deinococcus sp.]|uniref:L-serine ammonia-lyase, iron-sulfur-dependent, subunit beta n=1 Tax=Deinococcus sp. TaxID=47478 RepID=UPI003C7BDE98